jgi:hypothetical protein
MPGVYTHWWLSVGIHLETGRILIWLHRTTSLHLSTHAISNGTEKDVCGWHTGKDNAGLVRL